MNYLMLLLFGIVFVVLRKSSVVIEHPYFIILYLVVCISITFCVLNKKGKREKYGFCLPKCNRIFAILVFVSFFIGSSVNVLIIDTGHNNQTSFFSIIYMLIAVVIEEFLFRSSLINYLEENLYIMEIWKQVLISSILFSFFHFTNLLSGSSFPYILLQVFCALGMGIYLGLLFCVTNSIIPSIIVHYFINITAPSLEIINDKIVIYCIATTIMYVLCGIIIYYFNQKTIKNQ